MSSRGRQGDDEGTPALAFHHEGTTRGGPYPLYPGPFPLPPFLLHFSHTRATVLVASAAGARVPRRAAAARQPIAAAATLLGGVRDTHAQQTSAAAGGVVSTAPQLMSDLMLFLSFRLVVRIS